MPCPQSKIHVHIEAFVTSSNCREMPCLRACQHNHITEMKHPSLPFDALLRSHTKYHARIMCDSCNNTSATASCRWCSRRSSVDSGRSASARAACRSHHNSSYKITTNIATYFPSALGLLDTILQSTVIPAHARQQRAAAVPLTPEVTVQVLRI